MHKIVCLTRTCFKQVGIECHECNKYQYKDASTVDHTIEKILEQRKLKSESNAAEVSSAEASASQMLSATAWQEDVERSMVKLEYDEDADGIGASEVLSATAWQEGSKHVCPFCDGKFDVESDANQHMVAEHGVSRTYRCPVEGCRALVADKRGLATHMIVTHKMSAKQEQAVPCSKCPRVFTDEYNLKHHCYIYHGRRSQAVCEICGAQTSNMTQHLQRHQPRDKWNKFPYYGCDRTYMLKANLIQHIRFVHERDKYFTYPCKNCAKMFDSRAAANAHYISCAGVRRFVCDICHKSFSYKANLTTHRRKVHREQLELMFATRK